MPRTVAPAIAVVAALVLGADVGSAATYRSRPDLRPPDVGVYRALPGTGAGLVFLGPKVQSGSRQSGALIVDDRGEPVWFRRAGPGLRINDFRAQTYRGQPVLTWWEGRPLGGYGRGVGYIADTAYRIVARVRMRSPYAMDLHELLLTPRGTALVIAYQPRRRDLRAVGGPRRGRIMDNLIQEIDVRTGRVLFSWNAVGSIAMRESYRSVREDRGQPWDFFHANSVEVDAAGDFIVSARYSNSVTKISRRTRRVVWRLGGKRSDFRMAPGTRFHLAHDARWQPDGTLRVLDNSTPAVRDRSRVLTLAVDERARRVALVGDVRHPRRILAATQANAQLLPGGTTFVGWGSQGRWSEFGPAGELLYDAELPDGYDSYRAYRLPWVGRPYTKPAVAAARQGDSTVLRVSWNGATEVATWRVFVGRSDDGLRLAGDGPRTGFETRIAVPGRHAFAAVQALDAEGRVLSASPVASTS